MVLAGLIADDLLIIILAGNPVTVGQLAVPFVFLGSQLRDLIIDFFPTFLMSISGNKINSAAMAAPLWSSSG